MESYITIQLTLPPLYDTCMTHLSNVKGNLAHKVMALYFLCVSFHVDIYNMLETKDIGNPG